MLAQHYFTEVQISRNVKNTLDPISQLIHSFVHLHCREVGLLYHPNFQIQRSKKLKNSQFLTTILLSMIQQIIIL
jgi:hypothetical protein